MYIEFQYLLTPVWLSVEVVKKSEKPSQVSIELIRNPDFPLLNQIFKIYFILFTFVYHTQLCTNFVLVRLVVEPKLLNFICRTYKEVTKSRRWALYLKNWASYSNFRGSRYDRILSSQNFQISISHWIFEIWV